MSESDSLLVNAAKPSVVGFAIIFLFFGVFGAWAFFAPLQSAAIAPGVVSVETQRKSIQHLEGGIVGVIHVRDGGQVGTGDVLVELDDTRARTSLDLVRGRYLAALALDARLTAERDLRDTITYPEPLAIAAPDGQIASLRDTQARIFAARKASLDGETAILEQRIAQFEAEREGLTEQMAAQTQQYSLIEDEINSNRTLFDKGLTGKARLRELQKELTELRGQRAQSKAAIARIGQSIAETRLQISELRTRRLNEVVEQLREVQTELFDLTERIRAAQDVLTRTQIRAPLAGTVVGLQVHTVGGVIGPGERLLDIVPRGERLVVEAKVDPADIDIVAPGLNALVRLTAFTQRNYQPLPGRVLTVSADRLVDERTGLDYFRAHIELTGNLAEHLDGQSLYPGMQAEVMIVTGARTPVDYLTQPLTQSMNRAFREQ